MTEDRTFQRIMIITAHPDDSEFGAAGTVARFTRQGAVVIYVVCTDGNKGTSDASRNTLEVAKVRRREQSDAAAVLGVSQVVFLGYEDGELQPTAELRRDITRQVRRHKPDLVICHTPVMALSLSIAPNHPDHLASGQAAFAAVYPSATSPHLFPELLLDEKLEPHKVQELWFQATDQPNVWVDISDTVDLKIQALRRHESQVGSGDWIEGMVRERSALVGKEQGYAHAEAFRRYVIS